MKSKLQKKIDDPNSRYWKNKADKTWSTLMHLLYKKCAINKNCKGRLEAHHLISRKNKTTRYCLNNGIVLCSLHHKFSITLSAHSAPIPFAQWLKDNDPEQYDWVLKNNNLNDDTFISYENQTKALEAIIQRVKNERSKK